MAFLRGFIGLVTAILFTIFAVANRNVVDVIWSPVAPPAKLPLYLVTLGALAIGVLLGGFMVWLNTLPGRWEKVKLKRHLKKLEHELDEAKKSAAPAPTETAHPLMDNHLPKTAL